MTEEFPHEPGLAILVVPMPGSVRPPTDCAAAMRLSVHGAPRTAEVLRRLQHLEAELEGLQDALYRRAVLEDAHIDDLRTRTAPEQLARDLSQDARKRGL